MTARRLGLRRGMVMYSSSSSSHVTKSMDFLKSRGYDSRISKGILDSLKRAGIAESALNGVLLSLGGTGSVRNISHHKINDSLLD